MNQPHECCAKNNQTCKCNTDKFKGFYLPPPGKTYWPGPESHEAFVASNLAPATVPYMQHTQRKK